MPDFNFSVLTFKGKNGILIAEKMCLIHGKDIPMKKFIAALILTALCFAAGCNNPAVTATTAPSQNPSPSTTTADPTTAPPSASAEQLGTDDPSPSQTLEITSSPSAEIPPTTEITQAPTSSPTTSPTVTPTPVPDADTSTIYGTGVTANMLVGIDQFGRTFDIINGEKNKEVGMFFWLWMGLHYHTNEHTGVYDATKILEKYGQDILFKQSSDVSPAGQFHWWGEPLWGYYRIDDEWVIRKQMELLTLSGVDFLVFDTTNAWTYTSYAQNIMRVINEMMNAGWDAPKVAFYTHSRSMDTVRSIYNDIYSRNIYPNTWYKVNGKPFIVAYTDPADDMREAQSRGEASYSPAPYSSAIASFFHFAKPQWPSDPYYQDGFAWIEWSYPQPMHGNMMNVSVASHPQVPMSFSITRGYKNWGRGYNVATQKNVSEDADRGTFFQSQWDTVHKTDPDVVFVDGWNEWIALKSLWDGEYMLCDAASKEFSRDIEMMKGGYNDAFYIQLIQNIRKYKGNSASNAPTFQKTIDINASSRQWNDVFSAYITPMSKSIARSSTDPSMTIEYKEAAARNNIQKIKVAHDSSYFYFYIECQSNITAYKNGENWMNLLIGTGNVSQKGWEGYEYAVNRSGVTGSSSDILRLDKNGRGTKCGAAQYSISGKIMQVRIPRTALGLGANENTLYFKVADNVTSVYDIMDYYVSGKSMPMGRLSYRYG